MPEGPEMVFLKEETEQFIGQKILSANGSEEEVNRELNKKPVLRSIKTFGKELFYCFDGVALRIHLMFFGKYAINNTLKRTLRLGLQFQTGEINFYECSCSLIYQPLDLLYNWSADIMNSAFDAEKALVKLCSKPDRLICEALLDQEILAGVGNGIKNDVLYRCRVHPESRVGEMPERIVKKLIEECVNLSAEYLIAIREGTPDGHWQVYKRKVCLRDGLPIRKEKIGKGGRSCYFCDKCQELYWSW